MVSVGNSAAHFFDRGQVVWETIRAAGMPPKTGPVGWFESPESRRFALKRKRFSEERMIRILKESEQGGKKIRDLCRVHGISENAFDRWRRQ